MILEDHQCFNQSAEADDNGIKIGVVSRQWKGCFIEN